MTTTDVVTTTLPLSSISIGYNPRRYFDKTAHADLVASLRLRGMLQPMLVRPAADGSYVVVAGGRRYRAALEAFGAGGSVPVIIRQMSDQEALEAAIDENDVRDDASETEQADAAVRVLAACRDDRAEAARRLGWSQTKLDRRLALARLSETVKTVLDERRIKVGRAELLAAVPADKQDRALETILAAKLDVGKTRELLMRVTQALGTAIFDKAECTLCPFNSSVQRALFQTHVDDGHCTNAPCFQLKTEAVEQARAAAAAEEAARNALMINLGSNVVLERRLGISLSFRQRGGGKTLAAGTRMSAPRPNASLRALWPTDLTSRWAYCYLDALEFVDIANRTLARATSICVARGKGNRSTAGVVASLWSGCASIPIVARRKLPTPVAAYRLVFSWLCRRWKLDYLSLKIRRFCITNKDIWR